LDTGRFDLAYAAAAEAVRRSGSSQAAQVALARAWGKCVESGLLAGSEADLLERLSGGPPDGVKGPNTAEAALVRAGVLARLGRKDEAKKILSDVLGGGAAAEKPLEESLLLRCADLSRCYELGVEEGFFRRCEREHAVSP